MANKCGKCGEMVVWEWDGLRKQCLNASDFKIHWDTCSEIRNKRVMAEGVPFEDKKGTGFRFAGKKHYFEMMTRGQPPEKPIVDCPGCVPHWEVCPNNCPNNCSNVI